MKKIVFIFTIILSVALPKNVFAQGTIVDVAVNNKDFSTLVTALKAADLVGALQGDGPFTVFAPTNDAFGKLDSNTLSSLLKEENQKALANILTYHVWLNILIIFYILLPKHITSIPKSKCS